MKINVRNIAFKDNKIINSVKNYLIFLIKTKLC